jgi:hypothetical protein
MKAPAWMSEFGHPQSSQTIKRKKGRNPEFSPRKTCPSQNLQNIRQFKETAKRLFPV